MKKEEDDKWIYGGLKGPCFYYYLITYSISYIEVRSRTSKFKSSMLRLIFDVQDRT